MMKAAIIAALAVTCGLPTAATATLIDFEATPAGAFANGSTISGVTFYDTLGNEMSVSQYAESNFSNALGVFGDDTSALRMVFATASTDLSLYFGNDEVCLPNNCIYNADRAYLQLFFGGSEVGNTFVLFNQNNVNDQQIALNGITFDEAIFTYVNSSFEAGNLIEVVDNIEFSAAGVPEPASWAMMIGGLALVGGAMRRRRVRVQFA